MKIAVVGILLGLSLAGQTQPPKITLVAGLNANPLLSPAAYASIVGTNFGTSPKFFLGTTPCQLISISDTRVFLQIPSGTAPGVYPLTVQTAAGTSDPVSVSITPTSPVIVINNAKPPITYFFDITSAFIALPTPSPGDRVFFYVDGVGPARPPVPPRIQIDGSDVPVLASTISNALLGGVSTPVPAFKIQVPSLPGGPHTMQAIAGGVTSPAITFTVVARGLFTSQTGLTFNAVQGGPSLPAQSFSVLSGAGTLNFTLTTSTISGGSWLSATPQTGTSTVATAGVAIQVQANPSGLAVGTYYGRVTIASPDVPNSPQIVTVVLVVSTKAGPSIDKTGAIFVGTAGGVNPTAQVIKAFNPGSTAVNYTSSLQGTGATIFKVTPAAVAIPGGQSQAISIQPTITNIPTGVNTAKLTISFSDGTVRTVNLLLILAPGAASLSSAGSSGLRSVNASCAPTKLLPVFTLLGDSFNVPAAFPASVEVTIVDDCGNPMNAGDVILSFSNGDPPLRLDVSSPGQWSATWPPANARSSVVLTVTAARPEDKLTGTAQISGGVNANPDVPAVTAGGVVETAAYGAPVAPGNLISIFGAKLSGDALGATSVPLPNLLLTTSVLIDGDPIPLFYASDGQVNAVVPYGLSVNTRHQLVVLRGNTLSVPQSVLVGVTRPGVFTVDASGTGQGHIYKFDAAGNQLLVDKNAPAKAGDTLVIYCSGLGAVAPALAAGTATPLTFLTKTTDTLTATIGGRPAQVNFSGLTPGGAGLYQVNLVVPAGLPDSDATALQLSISGQDSSLVTLAIHK